MDWKEREGDNNYKIFFWDFYGLDYVHEQRVGRKEVANASNGVEQPGYGW